MQDRLVMFSTAINKTFASFAKHLMYAVQKSPWRVHYINPLCNPIVATRAELTQQIYDVTTASVFVST